MDKSQIHQIKPQSVLDPPQIKVSDDVAPPEVEEMATDKPKTSKIMKNFKLPKFKFNFKNSLGLKIALGVFVFILVFMSLMGILVGIPAYAVYKEGQNLEASARSLKDSFNSQDINVIESEFNNFKTSFNNFEQKYNRLLWLKIMPIAGNYVADGQHAINAGKYGLETGDIVIETIKPYADIIGLASTDGEDTANDRIEFLVQTLETILPKLDEVTTKVALIQAEIDQIDPNRYPEHFKGQEVRAKMSEGKMLLNQGATLLTESKPLLESAPYLLGVDDTREYLLIFQNDKELRPTGGFITAYALIDVTNGKVDPVDSDDIYDLDGRYTPSVKAPDPIIDYLMGPYKLSPNYRLRDMNWSPDFDQAMDLFAEEIKQAGIDDIDGIIAVDTHVVVNLLDVLGEVGVSGFGNYSNKIDERCDCPQVIYELEAFADVEGPVVWNQDGSGEIIYAPENYGQRKEIIGPLMNSILSNALGQPKEKLPDLFGAAFKSITEKHVLLYLFDEKAQSGAIGANFAGKLRDYEGDYLHVNDANLGGRKSNLYVTHEVEQLVEKQSDGSAIKTVTITYNNPQDHDGWLNSVLPNWTRVYVPQGSELLESDGFDEETLTYDELEKTVFAGGFQLRPNGIKKITLKYKLPNNFDNNYNILIQKQPGKDVVTHSLTVGKSVEDFYLKTDQEISFKF